MNSKAINPKWLDESGDSVLDKVKFWIDEHNPIPYRIRFWFNDQDIFHPTRIYRKVSNIVRWIPILWKDADWDYCHLYNIMEFKIRNMREHHVDHDMHLGVDEIAEQMQLCADALKRLSDDEYGMEDYVKHKEKYPDKPMIDVPGKPGWKQTQPSNDPAEHADFLKLVDAEDKAREADYETFTSILKKHSRGWWC